MCWISTILFKIVSAKKKIQAKYSSHFCSVRKQIKQVYDVAYITLAPFLKYI